MKKSRFQNLKVPKTRSSAHTTPFLLATSIVSISHLPVRLPPVNVLSFPSIGQDLQDYRNTILITNNYLPFKKLLEARGFVVKIVDKRFKPNDKLIQCAYFFHGDPACLEYNLLRKNKTVHNHFQATQLICKKSQLKRTLDDLYTTAPICVNNQFYLQTYQIQFGIPYSPLNEINHSVAPNGKISYRSYMDIEANLFLNEFLKLKCLQIVKHYGESGKINYYCNLCNEKIQTKKCQSCKAVRKRILNTSIQFIINILYQQTLDNEKYIYRKISQQELRNIIKIHSYTYFQSIYSLFDQEYEQLQPNTNNQLKREQLQEKCKQLIQEYEENNKSTLPYFQHYRNVWICKPCGKSRGRGIFLIDDLQQIFNQKELSRQTSRQGQISDEHKVNAEEHYIIQKYVEGPLLYKNRKLDIRQWVLVHVKDGVLNVFFYKKPYARLCIQPYELENILDPYIHLTNNAVQKHGSAYEGDNQLMLLEDILNELNIDVKPIIQDMKKIAELSIQKIADNLIAEAQACQVFELLGYDFLIDCTGSVRLIEINVTPTMEYSTQLIKDLVDDMCRSLVDIIFDVKEGQQSFEKIISDYEVHELELDNMRVLGKTHRNK